MKTHYFTKVENKYVFNVSLIFWHLFIAISTLVIVICIGILAWSIIPPFQKKVVKQEYPTIKEYPEPVKVILSDLTKGSVEVNVAPIIDLNKVETPPEAARTIQAVEDTSGLSEYKNSLETLKKLIPPAKYNWEGSGYWYYPEGERYWVVYKKDIYREWITTEPDLEDILKRNYNRVNANNYSDKNQILSSYNGLIKLLPESKRMDVLQYLVENTVNEVAQNVALINSLSKVVSKMRNVDNTSYINDLSRFGVRNSNVGVSLFDYLASIIDKFVVNQRIGIITSFINGFFGFFDNNLNSQIEATNLFIPFISQIPSEQQIKFIEKYYQIYADKNYERKKVIAQIETEHNQAVASIDQQYEIDFTQAGFKLDIKKEVKHKFLNKSLQGIAGGIVLIVLIATFLVFFSIQRSIKKIEEKIIFGNSSDSNHKE